MRREQLMAPIHEETQMEFRILASAWAQPHLLWPFGKWPSGWKTSLSVFSLCYSGFHISESLGKTPLLRYSVFLQESSLHKKKFQCIQHPPRFATSRFTQDLTKNLWMDTKWCHSNPSLPFPWLAFLLCNLLPVGLKWALYSQLNLPTITKTTETFSRVILRPFCCYWWGFLLSVT